MKKINGHDTQMLVVSLVVSTPLKKKETYILDHHPKQVGTQIFMIFESTRCSEAIGLQQKPRLAQTLYINIDSCWVTPVVIAGDLGHQEARCRVRIDPKNSNNMNKHW